MFCVKHITGTKYCLEGSSGKIKNEKTMLIFKFLYVISSNGNQILLRLYLYTKGVQSPSRGIFKLPIPKYRVYFLYKK